MGDCPYLYCAVIVLASGASWGAEYHVAQPGGADANPGRIESPLLTIRAAVEKAQPGDTVVIHAGLYREAVELKTAGTEKAPVVVEGAPHEEVVITGADALPAEKWEKLPDRPVWRHAPWTYRGCAWNLLMAHPADEKHKLIGRTEQVILDGKPLRQVLAVEDLAPGAFCADPIQSKALYLCLPEGDAPSKHVVEASLRPVLMHLAGSHIIVRDLHFRFACNASQHAALSVEGDHNRAENCVVEYTNGVGAGLRGEQNVLSGVVARFNGQMGMNGGGSDNLMVGCLLISNNVKGYSKGWEAGGIKIANSRRFHVDRCLAVKNDGPGFWFDIDNRDEIIERCYAAENYGPGVFVEISKTASVRNNLCVRNGLKDEPGAWGHSGILLGEAMQCLVENNVCVGNRSGIAVRQQNLRTLKPDPKRGRETEKRYYSQGHVFRHNISAFNRDWQFVLFGDNPFFGPHPSKLAAEQTEMPPSLMALHDPAQREWRMEQNLYYRGDGKGLICWGAPWRPKHLSYEDISAFQRACNLNLEQDSLVADPQFINRQGGNFALSPDSPAKRLGAGFTAPPADPAALEAVK